MRQFSDRRGVLRFAAAAAATGLLAPARACEVFTGTLRVYHPWTRATVAGSGTAVLCMNLDEVTQTDRLIGVSTPIASGAELVDAGLARPLDLLLTEGSETVLREDGLHIRLLNVNRQLEAGRQFSLQLHFERSGTTFASLNVDFPSFPAFRFK